MHSSFYAKLARTNIRLNRRIYVPYMLTCIGTAALYYIIYSLSQNSGLITTFGGGHVAFILQLGSNVIAVFAVLFLFYTNSFLIKRRQKEFGLYSILGMEKRHIAQTMLFESLYMAVISIGLGLLGGLLLAKLMHLLLLNILHLGAGMAIEISAEPILRTVLLFLGIFALTFLNTARVVYRARPIELLHGGETGEKEPKAKWIITLLGLLFMGGGYYIAQTIESPVTAIMLFFVAVILVVLGTYCLFTSGSISLLKLLKRNKGYYYQTKHFISVSGMMYRMKQNAAGLASICIFCTCVLVILSTTISLYAGVEDVIRDRYPRNIVMKSWEATPERIERIDAITEKVMGEMQLTPVNRVKVRYNMFVTESNEAGEPSLYRVNNVYNYDNTVLTLFLLADYNECMGTDVALNPDEVLLYTRQGSYDQDSFAFGERTYTIKERIDDPDLISGGTSIYQNDYQLIVPDEEMLRYMRGLARQEGDAQGDSGLSYWYGFDLDASGGVQTALYTRLAEEIEGEEIGSFFIESAENNRAEAYGLYGGLFFVGFFMGAMFMMATVLTIYYKQISEGYDDNERFRIMRKVGMSHAEVRGAIRSQVLTVFFLPLVMAAVHVAFAFKMITKMLSVLNLTNVTLFAGCCVATLLVFSVFYALVYLITARTYYKIVSV